MANQILSLLSALTQAFTLIFVGFWSSKLGYISVDASRGIGQLVGMATHDGENVIKVTSYRPTSSRASYNLHHEKIGRPRRVATVLVYLTSLAGPGGG